MEAEEPKNKPALEKAGTAVRDTVTIIKKLIGTAILIAAIVFLVKVFIEGKYVPILINFAQLLLNTFLAVVDSLKNWLIK